MQREVVLDTETTGLDPEVGDRIVEIGAVELAGHVPTGRTFHVYINPERAMSEDAFRVHGLGDEFLADKPRFAEVVDDLTAFLGEAQLVIHNAAFDMRFLNAELRWAGRPILALDRAIDTLEIARRRFPGAPASLDALCRRFGIDNSARTLHGALLDSEILAEVYLELIGGRQPDLQLAQKIDSSRETTQVIKRTCHTRQVKLPPLISTREAQAHEALVEQMGDNAIWRQYESRRPS